MCGYLASFNRDDSLLDFEKALDLLGHRGPDFSEVKKFASGIYGHKRLSIIGLTEDSNQPIVHNKDVLLYNGEIYNFKDLGKRFLTNSSYSSDTEVLIRLLSKYGAEIIEQLDGIFTFVFYSEKENTILIGRDRMGIKPLYYTLEKSGLLVSSEIKALLPLMSTVQPNDSVVLEQLKFGYVSGDKTLIDKVLRFPKGCYGKYSLSEDSLSFHSFFDHLGTFKGQNRKNDELVNLFTDSIKGQLLSDVPLGVMLSGGLDSSLVTSLSSTFLKDLNSYTIKIDHAKYDETPYAKSLLNSIKVNYVEYRYNYETIDFHLENLTFMHDEPLRHINSLPIHLITDLAKKQGIKVLLAGEGADELFGGYGIYKYPLWKFVIGRSLGKILKWLFGQHFRNGRFQWVDVAINAKSFSDFLVNLRSSIPDVELSSLTGNNLEGVNGLRTDLVKAARSSKLDITNTLLYLDQNTHLCSLLDRQDKMSMAASIECRVPFLSNDLVNYANSLPGLKKTSKGKTKIPLRILAANILPENLVNRPKHPFGIPLREQLMKSELFNQFVINFEQTEVVKRKYVSSSAAQILESFVNGSNRLSDFVWNLFAFETWLKVYFKDHEY